MPVAPPGTGLIRPSGLILPPLPPAELDAGPDFDLKTISKDYVTRLRADLAKQQRDGVGGGELVSHYTAHIDRLIQYLFAAASQLYTRRHTRLQQRCAVLAQGGYGRGELNPYSDLDLLFLYNWKVTPYVETICEMLYYNLLDAGCVVGHAVRTVRTCTRLAAQDLQVKTSLLDARPLCGDGQLSREFELALECEIIGSQTKRFFQEKAQESRQRHAQHGNSPYRLEPNIKDSPGGLRDLHTAWWLAKVKFRIRTWHDLFQKGIVPQQRLDQVEAAREFVWGVRNALHLATHSECDHLTVEQQDQLAPQLGFADVASFMYEYYRHATTLYDFSRLMLEQCLETPRRSFFRRRRGRDIRPGVRIDGQTLAVTRPEILTDEPVNIVTVFHDAQRHGVHMSRSTQQLLRDTLNRLPPDGGESPAVRSALYAVLNWKQRVADTLWLMHRLGVLGWILPEFGMMQWRIQRDLYHVYTVDEHTLYGVAALEQLREGQFKEDLPLLTQVMREIDQPQLLFLAMLYHDVGKGHGSEHEQRSALMVRQAAERWGMAEDDAHEWYLLVQHHLLMSYIAQRRDISDDGLIAEFARTVEHQDMLKKLYLLTFADMKAVGPQVWNSWKAGLLDELYLRTLERFETGLSVEEDPQARVQRRKDMLATLLPSRAQATPDQLRAFLDDMPDSYFLLTPEEAVPDHFRLLTRFIQADGHQAGHDPYRLALVHRPEREYSELTIVTHDRPGLFALLTGVLAVNNLNVAGARISTSRDGLALDVFRLSHAGRAEVVMNSELWARLRIRLGAVLRGERTLEDLLHTTRPPDYLDRHYARVPTEITVDNSSSPAYTVIDVTAPDRTGFLFRVTAALFQLGLIIHLAKITTNVHQILDVFYVTDSQGDKITDPDQLAAALRRRISEAEGRKDSWRSRTPSREA